MATVFEKFSIAAFVLLLLILFGVSACEPPFPDQTKADLPADHTEQKSYAYHKPGLYIPEKNCVQCHGDSRLKGGISPDSLAAPACHQCHPDIWTGVIEHTRQLKGIDGIGYHKSGLYDPQMNCVQCHGKDLKGGSFDGSKTPSCYECHGPVWDWNKTHTLRLTGPDGMGYHNPTGLQTPQTHCVQCHGKDLKGGTFNGKVTKSCYQCHKTAMWDWKSSHTVKLTGVDGIGYHQPGYNLPLTNCITCHGTDLKGGTSKRSCYQCHKTAVWDWKSSHTVKLTGVDGTGFHKPGYNTPLTNCVTCHGTDLKGGTSKRSCYQCHKSAVWDWKSIHTVNISGHLHKPGFFAPLTNCTQCHGSDLKGGSSGKSCYTSTCHATAVWDWKSVHTVNIAGKLHKQGYFSPLTNCVKCHGTDLKGGISGKSCYTSTCHTTAVWDWKATHIRSRDGVMHMTGSNSTCTKCHGTGFTGGISGKSCYGSGCHQSGRPPG